MSGYKRATITLTRDEYDRLHAAGENLRVLPEASPYEREAINQQGLESLRSSVETIQNRQNIFHHVIAGFQHDLRAYEEINARRAAETQAAALQQAQQSVGNLWEDVTALIADQEQRFASQQSFRRQETQAALDQVAQEFHRLANDAQRKQEIAAGWYSAAQALAGFIQQNYACDFFAPGQMENIQRSLYQAADNLAAGMPESALPILQQQYFALSDLRQELEAQHSEWQMLASAAWETASKILAIIEASEYVGAVDLDGSPMPYEINLAHWSEGALDPLVEKLFTFLEGFQQDALVYSIEALREWRETLLPGLYRELEEIVQEARIRAINSQLRINIADLVVQALGEQGFHLQAASYHEADERQSYLARLTTEDGCEVMVKVEPAGDTVGENELHLHSIDREERTEHELQQRWKEISRSLSGYGLGVGNVIRETSSPSYGRSPRRERNRLRGIAPAQQSEKLHRIGQQYGD
jgi:HAMP domain-containing protein